MNNTINIIFDNSINFNGYFANSLVYSFNNEITIKINPDSKENILFLIIHELTHLLDLKYLKELFINYIINELEVNAIDNQISDELICDIAGHLISNNINNSFTNLFINLWKLLLYKRNFINKCILEYSICYNKLIPYTNHEIKNFKLSKKIIIAKSTKDIKEYIDTSLNTFNNTKLYLGKIPNKFSRKLQKLLGINIYNYNVVLKNNSIRHILKKHSTSNEILRGQIPVSKNDFLLIPKMILTSDSIIHSGYTAQNKIVLKITKKTNYNYHIILYISDKSKSLEIQTLYKRK